jgi:hypothetical protein
MNKNKKLFLKIFPIVFLLSVLIHIDAHADESVCWAKAAKYAPHRTFMPGHHFLVYRDYLVQFPEIFRDSAISLRELQPNDGGNDDFITLEKLSPETLSRDNSGGTSVGLAFLPATGNELVPGEGSNPGTYDFLHGGVGARWYF